MYTALNTNSWDNNCKIELATELKENSVAVDGLALMLYGGIYSSDDKTVSQMVDQGLFKVLVKARLNEPNVGSAHLSVRFALEKAIGRR
jgi:hypothetical protein